MEKKRVSSQHQAQETQARRPRTSGLDSSVLSGKATSKVDRRRWYQSGSWEKMSPSGTGSTCIPMIHVDVKVNHKSKLDFKQTDPECSALVKFLSAARTCTRTWEFSTQHLSVTFTRGDPIPSPPALLGRGTTLVSLTFCFLLMFQGCLRRRRRYFHCHEDRNLSLEVMDLCKVLWGCPRDFGYFCQVCI